jgi:hypothetical protein
LAALVPSADESQAETHLMGTYGYAAHECWSYGTKAEISVSTICYLSLMFIY